MCMLCNLHEGEQLKYVSILYPHQYIGRDGMLATIHDDGDVIVRYSNNKMFNLNPEIITKV